MRGEAIGWVVSAITEFIVAMIRGLGYGGIVLAMAIESACVPLPSEIIMPFSGFLVAEGVFTLVGITLAGAAGNLLGSLVAYYAGYAGGRRWIERHGRWVLLSRRDLERADRWFALYGDATVFFSRLLPVVRTFISLPAGVARMPVLKFSVYTFIGSIPWCLALGYVGLRLGERWDSVRPYFHRFDGVIAVAVLVGVAWFVWDRMKGSEVEAR